MIAGLAGLLKRDEVPRWAQSELFFRYAMSIGGGTNEVQRNNLAERALGLPHEPGNDRGVAWSETRRGLNVCRAGSAEPAGKGLRNGTLTLQIATKTLELDQ